MFLILFWNESRQARRSVLHFSLACITVPFSTIFISSQRIYYLLFTQFQLFLCGEWRIILLFLSAPFRASCQLVYSARHKDMRTNTYRSQRLHQHSLWWTDFRHSIEFYYSRFLSLFPFLTISFPLSAPPRRFRHPFRAASAIKTLPKPRFFLSQSTKPACWRAFWA